MNKRLTNKIREEIADAAVKAAVVPELEKLYEGVRREITELVKDQHKDFDFANAGPYRDYIVWSREVRIDYNLAEAVEAAFMARFGLSQLRGHGVPLVDFEVPQRCWSPVYLESRYDGQAAEIMKPYTWKAREGAAIWERLKQALLSIATRKDLEEKLPELARFWPEEEGRESTALVPKELYDGLRKYFAAVPEGAEG